VVVENGLVTLEHQVLGRGCLAWTKWRRAGELLEVEEATLPEPARLGPEDARRIRSGRVFLAFWKSFDPEKPVLLNGVPIGNAPVSDWFLPRSFVVVPDEALGAIRRINEIVIENPRGEEFAVGGAYLEVTLDDGRIVRSTPSDFLVATSDRWNGWDEPTLLQVAPGEPVPLRALRFR
jgi:hypothetical protein